MENVKYLSLFTWVFDSFNLGLLGIYRGIYQVFAILPPNLGRKTDKYTVPWQNQVNTRTVFIWGFLFFSYYQICEIARNYETRSQAVARIADRTAKNCRGHVT